MLLNGGLLFNVKWRCLWHFQKRQDCRYSRTQTASARSAASNSFTRTIGMVNVAHGRRTTGLRWLRAAMILHRMARRFALIVTRIHIRSAASNSMKNSCAGGGMSLAHLFFLASSWGIRCIFGLRAGLQVRLIAVHCSSGGCMRAGPFYQ